MICFVIYGVNIHVSKHKFNSFEKNVWYFFVEIFHDFGWFFATRIRIRFIEADPDPADQNETDPDPQHRVLPSSIPSARGLTNPTMMVFSRVFTRMLNEGGNHLPSRLVNNNNA